MSGKKGSASRRKSTSSASPMPQLSDDIIQEIMNRTIDGSHTGLAKMANVLELAPVLDLDVKTTKLSEITRELNDVSYDCKKMFPIWFHDNGDIVDDEHYEILYGHARTMVTPILPIWKSLAQQSVRNWPSTESPDPQYSLAGNTRMYADEFSDGRNDK
eukprot:gene28857-32045_t